jgi:hypothetical protein
LTSAGEIRLRKPIAWQEVNGARRLVRSNFVAPQARRGAASPGSLEIAFALGAYDRTRPLVIDPVLTFSTYFGDNNARAAGIAVDSADNVYLAGSTSLASSTNVIQQPGTLRPPQTAVVKMDESNRLLYVTYVELGFNSFDTPKAITVNAAGEAFVAGMTEACSIDGAPFLFKLNSAGSALVYS